MINENTKFSNLSEIANWQLDAENAKVGLPALQRGYVWKPKQVETLWDSLLRGFPIGSFLVSDSKKPEGKMDLLDGQQRATAISMGFYNPWVEVKQASFFSSKFKNIKETVPILWLDIAVSEEEEKGDFSFLPRLITQSHPWGFNHNSNVLGIASRENANKYFYGTYPHYNLKNVFPWDAVLPVPLVFLIEAILDESTEKWNEKVIRNARQFLSHIRLHYFDDTTTYISKLEESLNDKNISTKIEAGIKTVLETKIPVIILNQKQLEDESFTANSDASTLFVRINTLGTPLNGEELIYSIFKTAFPKSKEIVESAGTDFIAPSRIITLISRILLTEFSTKGKNEFRFHNQLKLNQFKNIIKDINGDFYIKMKQFAEDEESLKLLFNNAKSLLIGEKDYQLPYPLAVEIARNQDVFFIFLYWLYKSKINVEDIIKDEILHKNILASLTALNWFAVDMERFFNELASLEEPNIEFWNPKIYSKNGRETRFIANLPTPNYVREILEKKINKSWEEVFPNEEERNEFKIFFDTLNGKRSMLFYAQREYFNDKFKELQWETLLEDTNRPYDWDHIYPDNWWIYNIPNYSPVTQEWRKSVGNFRALSFGVNRSEGDKFSPKERLIEKERRRDSFITDNNWNYWQKIDGKINESQVEILAKAIVNRVADIYETWHFTLNVEQLFRDAKKNR